MNTSYIIFDVIITLKFQFQSSLFQYSLSYTNIYMYKI